MPASAGRARACGRSHLAAARRPLRASASSRGGRPHPSDGWSSVPLTGARLRGFTSEIQRIRDGWMPATPAGWEHHRAAADSPDGAQPLRRTGRLEGRDWEARGGLPVSAGPSPSADCRLPASGRLRTAHWRLPTPTAIGCQRPADSRRRDQARRLTPFLIRTEAPDPSAAVTRTITRIRLRPPSARFRALRDCLLSRSFSTVALPPAIWRRTARNRTVRRKPRASWPPLPLPRPRTLMVAVTRTEQLLLQRTRRETPRALRMRCFLPTEAETFSAERGAAWPTRSCRCSPRRRSRRRRGPSSPR
jgi:hypothetical protein